MCIPKTGSLLCIDHEILNMEFFFHKQYEVFIPERLSTQSQKAIELEPKRMEYFIFSALVYFC